MNWAYVIERVVWVFVVSCLRCVRMFMNQFGKLLLIYLICGMNSFCNAVKRCEDLLNTPYFLFLFIHHLHLPLTKIKNEKVDVMNKIIPTHATHTRQVLVLHSKGNVPEKKK